MILFLARLGIIVKGYRELAATQTKKVYTYREDHDTGEATLPFLRNLVTNLDSQSAFYGFLADCTTPFFVRRFDRVDQADEVLVSEAVRFLNAAPVDLVAPLASHEHHAERF
jgi:hypothetical protein